MLIQTSPKPNSLCDGNSYVVDELYDFGKILGNEVIDRIHEWGELGLSRLYLQVLDMKDLDHVHLIASDVMPAV